jgi:hypothetical protein
MFQFGCWAAITTAMMHIVIAVAERVTSASDGALNLVFAVCFAALGSIGIIVGKRGQSDALLVYGVARSAAVASVTLLVLSLIYLFIVPSMFIAAVTTCFAVAAVKAPGT